MGLRRNDVFHKLISYPCLAVAGTATDSSMTRIQTKLILWTGKKHSGKTSTAAELAETLRNEGFTVAGLLAPSLYHNGRLIGFDAFDLQSEKQAPLARRRIKENERESFTFIPDGLKLGRFALSSSATKSADLIIVDEFGPLELDCRGWRKNVDLLLASSNAVILLVVRKALTETVKQLYRGIPTKVVVATGRDSIGQVVTLLKFRRGKAKPPGQGRGLISPAPWGRGLGGMLMIGSAGANVGKTELACALLRKFSKSTDIIGIKVTTIRAKDGRCPRGGQGCGVCSSLDGDFCITEETGEKPPVKLGAKYLAPQFIAGFADSNKDTARFLTAGASRVFWLRVTKTHLKEGIAALLDIIGHDAISICESNSLRLVVEPGLFLIVKRHNLKAWKDSARQVKKYADRIIVSDDTCYDFDLDRIQLIGSRWTIQEKATAIIMAGGDSLRMGVDKSMLPIDGQPLIGKIAQQLRGSFEQILISANEPDKFAHLCLEVIPDRIPGQGPLMGIASALQASANEINFVVACDIPRINLSFVRKMLAEAKAADLVIPTTGDGRYEPLFAVYRKSALAAINQVLSSGRRKISDVFSRCKVKYIELGDTEWLTNLNTVAEYEEFLKQTCPERGTPPCGNPSRREVRCSNLMMRLKS